jgi:putative transposase
MGMSGISKSEVSRLCEDIDHRVKAFLDRPIEGDWPCLWIDATYMKVRQDGRIVSVAVIVAVGVNADGRREVLGMDIGPSDSETLWTAFLRKLARPGLKLVVSDAHEASKPLSPGSSPPSGSAAAFTSCATPRPMPAGAAGWAASDAGLVVSAFIATAFAENDAEQAGAQ